MRSCPKSKVHRSVAERYISSVLSGKIVACQNVVLMCKRHRDDLKSGRKRGFFFDPIAGQHVIDFFAYVKHSKGKWAGQVCVLEPWQQAVLWILFGWMRADGKRRFRTALIEVARKNGKSFLLAVIGLYLMIADGEKGAEVYAASTKKEQSRILHSEAIRIVQKSPVLSKRISIVRDNLHIKKTATKFEPLGRDSDSLDGLNPHGAIVDELHAHRDSSIWDVLESAMGAREQPLLIGITTAGFNSASFCYDLVDYGEKVLKGLLTDDTFFPAIYTMDEGDRWDDEKVWVKANPNLNVSVSLEYLQEKALRARTIPSALTNFKTKHLNVWTNAESNWLNIERWKACAGEFSEELLYGRECFAGLDLSNTMDVTALIYIFPPVEGDPVYRVVPRFWMPEETISTKAADDMATYGGWRDRGYLFEIPGAVIDYEYIYRQIEQDMTRFTIKRVGYDRWGSHSVYLKLEGMGLETAQIGQGFVGMNNGMKELEKLIVSKRLAHANNPMMNWMIANTVAVSDAAGNIKPDKAKSGEKIDGVVALIMACDCVLAYMPKENPYATRGLRVFGGDSEDARRLAALDYLLNNDTLTFYEFLSAHSYTIWLDLIDKGYVGTEGDQIFLTGAGRAVLSEIQ